MYAVPAVEEVVAVAKSLGIYLGPEEAILYRKYVLEQLTAFDTFVQARVEEPTPPLVSPARQPGYRPSPAEDRLNAWMWKCRIAGAADGLLAGKTVSFKDHIAVAGMPMRFGAFALEGFLPDFDATVVTRVLQAGGTIIGKNVMSGLSGGLGTGGAIGDYGRPSTPTPTITSPGARLRAPPRPWRLARWTSRLVATRAAPSVSRRLHPRASRYPCGSGRAHSRRRASPVQHRLLWGLHPDLLPRLPHRRH